MVTEKDVQWPVTRLFHNHLYQLYNSYVYGWESDYYSQTRSGYSYEVEIKISRSDFFADFKKEKHKVFSALTAGKTHVVTSWGEGSGDLICEYTSYKLSNRNMRFLSHLFDGNYKAASQIDVSKSATHEDYLNGYKNFSLIPNTHRIYAKATYIRIDNISDIYTPNCFYYAVPSGLISPEEVPSYAGLIYTDHNNAKVVKKAPYMHKRLCPLTETLLSKFYHETVRHRVAIRYGKIL